MFERFTDRARRVIVLAQEEARALQHNYIGTEHLLLGLIREGEGVGTQVLIKMDVDLGELRSATIDMIRGNSALATARANWPTPAAWRTNRTNPVPPSSTSSDAT